LVEFLYKDNMLKVEIGTKGKTNLKVVYWLLNELEKSILMLIKKTYVFDID
jgi:hypothetical protein